MHLSTALRVFGQLPAEPVEEWLTVADGSAGALLTLPVDAGDPANTAAWLRWCAVADGASAGAVLRELFAKAGVRLRGEGMTHLMCGLSAQHWLAPYLRDNDFTLADELTTLMRDLAEPPQPAVISAVTLRNATLADLNAISQLDGLAFSPAWRYSHAALADGFTSGHIFRVAQNIEITGYTFADLSGDHAHLVRIAVHPSRQRGGVGKLLLADGMAAAKTLGATNYTLNVQKSNTAAQNLYQSFGFRRIGEPLKIMRKEFEHE